MSLASKRALDIVVSILALVLLSPIFLLLALLIKLTSRGPVLFVQTRVGYRGRLFRFYKFRSMVVNATHGNATASSAGQIGCGEECPSDGSERISARIAQIRQCLDRNPADQSRFKIEPNDPNVTPLGRFIRRTSLDELPQFYNVLKGEMSLVGPRPPIPSEARGYLPDARKRLDVKPGLTCLWQIQGRSLLPFEKRIALDKEYIRTQSFWRDIVIILRTIPAVIIGRGAY